MCRRVVHNFRSVAFPGAGRCVDPSSPSPVLKLHRPRSGNPILVLRRTEAMGIGSLVKVRLGNIRDGARPSTLHRTPSISSSVASPHPPISTGYGRHQMLMSTGRIATLQHYNVRLTGFRTSTRTPSRDICAARYVFATPCRQSVSSTNREPAGNRNGSNVSHQRCRASSLAFDPDGVQERARPMSASHPAS